MDTWIPIWTSTVDSTLWEEPLHVRIMFFTLMLIRDPDHVVRQPFRRIVKYAHLSDDILESARLAEDALKVLSSPDSKSIDVQAFDGRRIKQVQDGWLVLNGEKYEQRRKILSARIRKTQKQRERRERVRNESNGQAVVSQQQRSEDPRFVKADGDQQTSDHVASRSHGRIDATSPPPPTDQDS